MNRMKALAAAALVLLLAAACGSLGNYGGSPSGTTQISGTVDSVDTNSRSIYLINTSGNSNSLYPGGGGGGNVRIYYDNKTTVNYQGRNYRPEDLERGDQVSVRVDRSGNQLLAQSMDVTYNARGGMASSSSPSGNNSVVHGTVRAIDNYARTVTVDQGYGSNLIISFSSNTPVYYNNQTYAPSNLQIGDQVDVRVTDLGGGRFSAQDFTVTQSMSSGGPYGSQYSTLRGTVRYVDSSARTIVIDSPTWMSGFLNNPSSTMTIRYGANAQVSYQGQLYPVTNLERGDVIDIQVQDLGGGNYLAQSITVVRSVQH